MELLALWLEIDQLVNTIYPYEFFSGWNHVYPKGSWYKLVSERKRTEVRFWKSMVVHGGNSFHSLLSNL